MAYKTFAGELKLDEGAGTFRATIARYHVPDADADIHLPSAFEHGAEVPIAAYGHNHGQLPVGVGVLGGDATRAWVTGKLFDTQAGREHYDVLKRLGRKQMWSYGYRVEKSVPGTLQGRPVRFLERVKVFEASPVLVGAGGSSVATEWVKSSDLAEGRRVYEIYRAGLVRRLRQELDWAGREAVAAAVRQMDLCRFEHDELLRRAYLRAG